MGSARIFDTLDHAHTIVRNLAVTVPAPHGSTTPAPVPFFLSTTGYGLWLDTTSDATFDFNASDAANITVDVATARLRIVLFTGDKDHPGAFPAILSAFAAAKPPVPTPSWLDLQRPGPARSPLCCRRRSPLLLTRPEPAFELPAGA